MADMMTFPDNVEEFMEQYKIIDTEQVYTNGAELVPIFRMKQWFEHLKPCEDAISRQAAIETAENVAYAVDEHGSAEGWLAMLVNSLGVLPSAQSERKAEKLLPDGTLHLFTDTDLSKVDRVLVSQNGTHYGDLYYADGEPKTGKWDAKMNGAEDHD